MCPDCKTRIHCGTVGLANLEKNHRGKKTCIKAKEKYEKAQKESKNPTILAFFNRPKAVPIPSTITPATKVKTSQRYIPVESPAFKATENQERETDHVTAKDFLTKLSILINSLPETIPEASIYDRLAVFAGNPEDHDDPMLAADDLWESTLNNSLKSALGWSDEENMDDIIRRGRYGLDGFVNFVRYFVVKRGVNEALFEGKLTHLVSALEKRLVMVVSLSMLTHLIK